MPKILKVDKPGDMLAYVGAEGRHPLIGVIDYAKVSPIPSSLNNYGVYGIFIHSSVRPDLTYGRGPFGHSSGSMICVAPGQIGGREDPGDLIDIDGWALLFHPSLLASTQLEEDIRGFAFFDYSVNEAIFVDEHERNVIVSLMMSIRDEIERPADGEQNAIIIGYLSALLHFCNRAYLRQFRHAGAAAASDDLLVKLSALLNDYYDSGRQLSLGVPSVQYFADKLCISPGYLSDMLKKTAGVNAGTLIRDHIVRIAKNKLMASGNVAKVAYDLGFEYPQHFSRMFKNHTGLTPSQYFKYGKA